MNLTADTVINYHHKKGGLNLNSVSGFHDDFMFKIGGQINRKYLVHKFFRFTKSSEFKNAESWTSWFKKNRDEKISIDFRKDHSD